MKRLILVVAVVGIVAGLGFYLSSPKTEPISPADSLVESAPVPRVDAPQTVEPIAAAREQPVKPARTRPAAESLPPRTATSGNAVLDASFLSRTVELLVSPQSGYQQKQEAWKQLREAGKLDQVIAELEQRMAADPHTAECPAALGQAYLQKCGTIKDVREQGILAMQADKVFDTALSLDPSNWEARFTKAVAMSYWPPMLNKGDEVIQNFQTLVQQQEAQMPQPQFAETYAWLGDAYQKAGRSNEAKTVWQRGATLFPADEKLQTKLASTP